MNFEKKNFKKNFRKMKIAIHNNKNDKIHKKKNK